MGRTLQRAKPRKGHELSPPRGYQPPIYEQVQQQQQQQVNPASSLTEAPRVSHLGAFFSPSTTSEVPTLPPVMLKMSPYMFYHGDPKETTSLVLSDPDEASDAGDALSSSTLKKGSRRKSTSNAGNNKEEEMDPNSVFRNGDLREALFASNQHFTQGKSSSTLNDVQMRYRYQNRLRNAAGGDGGRSMSSMSNAGDGGVEMSTSGTVGARSVAANLARVHRLILSKLIREAGAALLKLNHRTTVPVSSFGGAMESSLTGASSTRGGVRRNRGDDADANGGSTSPVPEGPGGVDLSRNSSVYSKAASELRIGMLIDVLREDFGIANRSLLEAVRDGLNRLNNRLSQGLSVSRQDLSSGSYTASTSIGCVPFGAVMELLDIYVNGQPSLDTRQACFDIFDVSKQRVVQLRFLRSLRGLSDATLRSQTGGGSFAMLKAVLDVFQQNEDLTTTLTKDQVVPLFDLDDGVLVEGFFEEIWRQIVVREFGVTRGDVL
jgi:hypothetical protein